MTERKQGVTSFVRQAAILGLASIFVRFIGFLYRIPLTNLIGDDGIGFYTRAYSIYTFAIVVSSGALPASISRLVSERIARKQYRNAHELFNTAMGFALFLGAVAGLVMGFGAGILADFFNVPEATYAIRAFAPTVFFVAMLAVFRGYFQGMKTAVPTAVSQVVEQIFNVVFTVWLAYIFFDASNLQYAVAGGAVGTGIGAIAGVGVVITLYMLIARDLKDRADSDGGYRTFETRGQQILSILRTSLPIIVSMGIFSVATLIDIGMSPTRLHIAGIFDSEEIDVLMGQFLGKFLLLTALPVSLSAALSQAVIPDITTSQVEMDSKAIRQKTNMALRISMMLSIPAVVGLTVLSDPVVALLFPAHPEGGWLLRFGAVSIIFIAMVQIFTGVLQGIGRVGIPIIGAVFGVVSKIPVNYFLISVPEINILGAVVSTIVCYFVAAVINLFYLRRFTGILPDFAGAMGKPIVASVGMGLVAVLVYQLLYFVVPSSLATIFALVFAFMAYIIFMGLIGGFRQRDIDALPLPKQIRRWMRF